DEANRMETCAERARTSWGKGQREKPYPRAAYRPGAESRQGTTGESQKGRRAMTQRRDVGQGSIFQQRGCSRYYLQYYIDGRRIREKTGTTSKRKAQDILTERLSQVRRGEWTAPRK